MVFPSESLHVCSENLLNLGEDPSCSVMNISFKLGLQVTSEVKYDLRFEILSLNKYAVMFISAVSASMCLQLWSKSRTSKFIYRRRWKRNGQLLDLVVSPQVKS